MVVATMISTSYYYSSSDGSSHSRKRRSCQSSSLYNSNTQYRGKLHHHYHHHHHHNRNHAIATTTTSASDTNTSSSTFGAWQSTTQQQQQQQQQQSPVPIISSNNTNVISPTKINTSNSFESRSFDASTSSLSSCSSISSLPSSSPTSPLIRVQQQKQQQKQKQKHSSPLPSLCDVITAMYNVLSLYYIHYRHKMKRPYYRLCKCIFYTLLVMFIILLLLLAIVARGLYLDAKRICTPPPSISNNNNDNNFTVGNQQQQQRPPPRPLVEYYIHGRGNGHYARSIAIIEELNNAGVDVRVFIGRATMWRAYQEAQQTKVQQQQQQKRTNNNNNNENDNDDINDNSSTGSSTKGTTTAIAVTSLLPTVDIFSAMSHAVERVMGDCEVAYQTNKYPTLVIADGDMPGMLRAKFGGIPSVGISHGQVFSIVDIPDWLPTNMHRAWSKQGRLNFITALFSNWEIGTNFLSMETRLSSGAISRPPLRPEVIDVARARLFHDEHLHIPSSALDDNPQLKDLLEHHVKLSKRAAEEATITDNNGENNKLLLLQRRKIVISYFRDSNCDMVTRSLLEAGFDVIDFDRSFRIDSPHASKSQNKWIIRRDSNDNENNNNKNNKDEKETLGKDKNVIHLENNIKTQSKPKQKSSSSKKKDNNIHSRRLSSSSNVVSEEEEEDDDEDHPRLIRITDRSLFVPLMAIADGVASSAGSQLMSECIYMDVPLLAMYEDHDDEQKLNVLMSRQRNQQDIKRRTHVYGMSSTEFKDAIGNIDNGKDKTGIAKNKNMKGRHLRHSPPVQRDLPVHQRQLQNGNNGATNMDNASQKEEGEKEAVLSSTTSNIFADRSSSSASLSEPNVQLKHEEFNKFISAVANSNVSQSYFEYVWRKDSKGNEAIIHHDEAKELKLDEAFSGMPDAAAIILEIIKQQQQDSPR